MKTFDQKKQTILLAADHAGFELKNILSKHLTAAGWRVEDLGADALDPEDDYPPIMMQVGMKIAEAPEKYIGIILGGSGEGEAMVVNRFPGVRATVYYGGGMPATMTSDLSIIKLSREHNDANVLSLGARFLDEKQATEAVDIWLSTSFSGEERHVRRIEEIDSIS